jgi:spermidine synthase
VDVDKSLKDISEKYFLQSKLNDKITFYPESARYFLNNKLKDNKKYDAIVIDIYVGKSLPEQALTQEFYESLKKLSPNIFINLITDRELKSDFSKRIFKTMFTAL